MGPVKPKFAYKCFACEETFRMLEEFREHNRNNPQCFAPNKKKMKPNEEATVERQTSPARSRRKYTMVDMTDLTSDFSEAEISEKGSSRRSSTGVGARSRKNTMSEVQCSYAGCSATREFQAGIDLHYKETHGPKTFHCPLESGCDAAFGVYHLLVDHLKCDHRLGPEQLRNMGVGVVPPVGKTGDLTPPDMSKRGGKAVTNPGTTALPTESEKPVRQSFEPKKGNEGPTSVLLHQEQSLSSLSIPNVEPVVSESGKLPMPTNSLSYSKIRKQQKEKAPNPKAPNVLATGSIDPARYLQAQQTRQQQLLQNTINNLSSHPDPTQRPQYQPRIEPYNTYFGLETAHAAGDVETEWNCHQLLAKMTLQEKRLEQQQYIQDPRFLQQQQYNLERRQQGLRQLLLRQQQQLQQRQQPEQMQQQMQRQVQQQRQQLLQQLQQRQQQVQVPSWQNGNPDTGVQQAQAVGQGYVQQNNRVMSLPNPNQLAHANCPSFSSFSSSFSYAPAEWSGDDGFQAPEK